MLLIERFVGRPLPMHPCQTPVAIGPIRIPQSREVFQPPQAARNSLESSRPQIF